MATPTTKTAAAPKNTAPNAAKAFEMPDFATWEKEQVGFAPYWNPEPGKFIYGAVVARDERDPEFKRYLVKTLMPMLAYRGPEDEREEVQLQPGEMFSISVYYSLAEPFDFMLEHFVLAGLEVPMKVTALKEVKTKKAGQTCWTWEMLLPPDWKKALMSKREEVRKQLAERAAEENALAFPG